MASPGSDSTSPVHKAYIGENEEGNAVARVSSESNAGNSSEQNQRSETEQIHIQQTQSQRNMSSNSDTINNPDVMRLLNTMRDEQKKALQDINDEQKATKDMFGRELEKLKKELIDSIERKIKTVKDEIMSKVTRRQQKLKDFEKTVHAQDAIIKQLSEGNTIQTAVPFYPDVTIIARNVRYHEGENITQKINVIIHTNLELPHEEVLRCERSASWNNKPGVVKIQMSSLDSKILVLRNKRKLNGIYKCIHEKRPLAYWTCDGEKFPNHTSWNS